jgi:adenosyl cobinamide kinase/adenosyl cobinamide phosphate guanylyltransferase
MVLVIGGSNQGKYAFAKTLSEDVIRDFHLQIRDCMEQGNDPGEMAEHVLAQHPNAAFTVAELGCGLVPMDSFERDYRESVGRISCLLAERAGAVYRVYCGIPVKIK